MRLIDSHCHLNADRFDRDADQVIGAARLAGVERVLVPGWNVASSERALACTDRFPWLDAAVGVHPHDAAKVDDVGWARVERWVSDPRVVAVGETGLDYDRVFSPVPDQLMNLRRNLALALETGKPAILHCRSATGQRDAQDALVVELRAAGVGGPAWAAAFGERPPAIIHSFSGPLSSPRTTGPSRVRGGQHDLRQCGHQRHGHDRSTVTHSRPRWVDSPYPGSLISTWHSRSESAKHREPPNPTGAGTTGWRVGRGSSRCLDRGSRGHRPFLAPPGRCDIPRVHAPRPALAAQEECTLAKATAISKKLRPLGDRVVIKPSAREEMTKSGIVLPDTVKEKPQEGTIIAAGPGKVLDDGKRETMDVKAGDKVLYAKYAGTEFKIDGDELLIVSQKDILAIVEG